MTNTLTDISRLDIVSHVQQNFNRNQSTGLACLIFLAVREQTSIAYQWREWGFTDIPEQVISWSDALDNEDDQISLAADIAAGLLEELAGE